MGDDGSPFSEPTCAPYNIHLGAKQVATGTHLTRVAIPVLSM